MNNQLNALRDFVRGFDLQIVVGKAVAPCVIYDRPVHQSSDQHDKDKRAHLLTPYQLSITGNEAPNGGVDRATRYRAA
jgi:hypothetical protein